MMQWNFIEMEIVIKIYILVCFVWLVIVSDFESTIALKCMSLVCNVWCYGFCYKYTLLLYCLTCDSFKFESNIGL